MLDNDEMARLRATVARLLDDHWAPRSAARARLRTVLSCVVAAMAVAGILAYLFFGGCRAALERRDSRDEGGAQLACLFIVPAFEIGKAGRGGRRVERGSSGCDPPLAAARLPFWPGGAITTRGSKVP